MITKIRVFLDDDADLLGRLFIGWVGLKGVCLIGKD